MKALSIRQPWAWLIVRPDLNGQARLDAIARQELKDIENRTWRTSYRGPVLIHASKGMTRGEYDDAGHYLCELYETGPYDSTLITLPKFEALQRGGIVGVANITDCLRDSGSRCICRAAMGLSWPTLSRCHSRRSRVPWASLTCLTTWCASWRLG